MMPELLLALMLSPVVGALLYIWLRLKRHALATRAEMRQRFEIISKAVLHHPDCNSRVLSDVAEMASDLNSRSIAWAVLGVLSARLREKRHAEKTRRQPSYIESGRYGQEIRQLMAGLDCCYIIHLTTLLPVFGLAARALLSEVLRPEDTTAFRQVTYDAAHVKRAAA